MGPTIHSALPKSQHFSLVAKGIFQPLLPSWYKHKPVKHKGGKSATACRKKASMLKDTQGILQSQGSTGYSLYLPGLIPRVISGAAPSKLLTCWKLQGWHPQAVTPSASRSLHSFSQVSSTVHPPTTKVHRPQHAGISELPQHQGRARPLCHS